MTQPQTDMQNLRSQLEQQTNNTDLSTQPIFNESPVLFLEVMGQESSNATSDQTSSDHKNLNTEQNASQIHSKKQQRSPEIHNYEQSEQSRADIFLLLNFPVDCDAMMPVLQYFHNLEVFLSS